MSNWFAGRYVPVDVPGQDLTSADMAQVTGDDWADIRKLARGYCRTVDATRSRKRMDGSATIARNGDTPYGTDDVSDDVTQDAVLLFARRLRDITKTCAAASKWTDTRETASWLYLTKDHRTITATRKTLQRWAVRDAARRNGYRVDVAPDEIDETPGAQLMRGVRHAEHVASAALISAQISQQAEIIWRTAFGDGSEFPTIKDCVFLADMSDDIGRAGIIATVAQARYGGTYGSRRQVMRTRDKAVAEWSDLSSRLDHARDELIYRTLSSDKEK